MPSELFLDSNFAIALTVTSDQLHPAAVSIGKSLLAAKTPIVTTQAVLFEIGNALSGRRHRSAAIQLLSSLSIDSTVKIIPISADLYSAAFKLFQERADKEWGLVDCASFVVMQQRGITDALSADEHFEQAGFRALLRSPRP